MTTVTAGLCRFCNGEPRRMSVESRADDAPAESAAPSTENFGK